MIDDHGRNSNLAVVLSVLWSPTTICVAALHAMYVVLSYYDGMLANVLFWCSVVVAVTYIGAGCLVLRVGVSSRQAYHEQMALCATGKLPVEYAAERSVHAGLIIQGLVMLTPAIWFAKMLCIVFQ